MKKSTCKTLTFVCLFATSLLLCVSGFSQAKKLPDGTIVYNDGTKKLPNGTVVYKDGTAVAKSKTITLPDGRVILRDGSERNSDNARQGQRKNGKWLPPGQAKKIYGSSARDYVPGQQKKRNHHKEWKDENGHKSKYKSQGKIKS